jgi:DeoR family transcriptional regulator, aga operon transcriptional repressor
MKLPIDQPGRLLTEERRREILATLERNGRVTINELRKSFGISAVTARSDLNALEAEGMLVRSHGGGIKPVTSPPDHPLKVREDIHWQQKQRIAQAAADLIKPGQAVMIGSGSTCGELASHIRRAAPEQLTVITYALNVALRLADAPNVSLILLGGMLRHVSNALVGPQTEQMVSGIHADQCFLAAVGVDAAIGVTTLDILEAQLNNRMMSAAKEITVLADASKFGHRSLSLIAPVNRFHRIITDGTAAHADIAAYRDRGIEVVLA